MNFKSGTVTGIDNLLDLLVWFLAGRAEVSTPVFTGVGTGRTLYLETYTTTVTENWTLTCTATSTNGGTFSVTGSVSGAQASAFVGAPYDNGKIKFVIQDGTTDFQLGDQFTFSTTLAKMDADERWEVQRYHGVNKIEASSFIVLYEPWRTIKGPYHLHTEGWRTSVGNTTGWISYDFVQPFEFTYLDILSDPSDLTMNPMNFRLQWSDNKTTWTDRLVVTNATFASVSTTNRYTLDSNSPGPKRYWRILIDANNGHVDRTGFGRVQMVDFLVFAEYNYATRSMVNLKAPGMTSLDPCYVSFQAYDRPTNDIYNIAVSAANGWVAQSGFDTQPGSLTAMALPLWDQEIKYWIDANGQRVVLGVRIATATECLYAGKILTFALPTQYPYPMLVAAPLPTAAMTKYTDSTVTMPFKGNRNNMKLRGIDGIWFNPFSWPYHRVLPNTTAYPIRDTDGYYPLLPITLYHGTTDNTYGSLDGVYFVSGFNNAIENTVVADGETHIVLQDGTLSGVSDMHTMRIA